MTELQEKAMRMALEALCTCGQQQKEAKEALRTALAHPEQESEAWTSVEDPTYLSFGKPNWVTPIPLYTAPPKREWVDLTDDDIEDEWRLLEARYLEEVDPEGYYGEWDREFVRAVLAKAKEKNT